MSDLVWVAPETIFSLHEASIARFGGTLGVRDSGLLESALARPQNVYAYGEADLFILAAALGAGMIKNHPFLDGNKRTGFLAAALFLESNVESFQASEEEVVIQTLGLAAGAISEAEYAGWLRVSCRKKREKKAR